MLSVYSKSITDIRFRVGMYTANFAAGLKSAVQESVDLPGFSQGYCKIEDGMLRSTIFVQISGKAEQEQPGVRSRFRASNCSLNS